jgi:hypothetical protein
MCVRLGEASLFFLLQDWLAAMVLRGNERLNLNILRGDHFAQLLHFVVHRVASFIP